MKNIYFSIYIHVARSHQHGQAIRRARRHANVDPFRSADAQERHVVHDYVDGDLRNKTRRWSFVQVVCCWQRNMEV